MDIWHLATFVLGIVSATAIWNRTTKTVNSEKQALAVTAGWFGLLSAIYFSLLIAWLSGFDLWGQLRYITSFALGLFIRIPLPPQKTATAKAASVSTAQQQQPR